MTVSDELVDKITTMICDDSRVSNIANVKTFVKAVLQAKVLVLYNDILESQLDTSKCVISIDNSDIRYNIDKEKFIINPEISKTVNRIIKEGYDPVSETIVNKFDDSLLKNFDITDIMFDEV